MISQKRACYIVARVIIQSGRLDLVPLTPAFLRAVLARDLPEAARIIGLSLPDGLLDASDVMAMRLRQLEADPSLQPWLLRAMALRDRPVMIGHIGFHTAPGPEYLRDLAPGAAELGFEVYPPFRRKGYAREASEALMRWARTQGTSRFVMSIRPDNAPSQALAAGLGFERIGSHVDEVDGVEDILERRSVYLRAATEADASLFFEHQRDAAAARMVAGPPMRGREAYFEHWIRTSKIPTNARRAILFDGAVAGYVGCFENDGVAEVCYWLGREFWGKGIASRALALYLLEEKRRPLVGRVAKRNPASIRVLQKCGFTIVREDTSPYEGEDVEGFVLELPG